MGSSIICPSARYVGEGHGKKNLTTKKNKKTKKEKKHFLGGIGSFFAFKGPDRGGVPFFPVLERGV